ncbi:methyl-accepting chemotaxis protein [Uliginosibacterium flavum]|uniref:PAS domain-containing methyl-accepting chemotaxis protein n=1 Tax=Uliginosibacterium flavum TaxID=1396831 RepID=A0ABV2TQN8_9RHOO
MRNNQPVTQRESIIPEGVFIYSRTDLKGGITEVNQAFADISGYAPGEMLGQPHNMIRHPDMPVEAFADMWQNLKAGRPWKGLVKNRRKNGDFYWVVANASPVRENGQVVGYQSVRTPPSRAQIVGAEKAYQRVREGDKSIRIQDGRVLRNHSSLVDTLLAFQTRLVMFVLLAAFSGLCGLATKVADWNWLEVVHEVSLIALLLAALYMLFWYLPRAFKRLANVRNFLEKALVAGDLSATLTPSYNDLIGEIAGRIDTLVSAMRATLQIIGDTTREVAETTSGLNQSVESLVSAASVQSASTSSAAAGVEEMTVSISEVAQHAASTQTVASRAGQQAQAGAELSERASATIRTLSTTVARSAETVEQLGTRTEEIGKVAGVIKEIADQTNLLALNAAIEAARAGEQGRGFAVVADEVRKLAERTAKATQEIDQMIVHIKADTVSAVDGMRQSAEQVGTSVALVHDAHDALLAINQQMDTTAQMVSEISHSSSEQSSAMTMMAGSVEQLSRLTEENLGVARDTEASSHILQSSVERMRKAVAQYKV